MVHIVFIALGTNLGDRPANLQAALGAFAPQVRVLAHSAVYETEPWGFVDQPAFLNMVLRAETELGPTDLLARLKELETGLGRIPSFRNGPRLIDLDILFYDQLILDTPSLVIPHPHLHERPFVLVPLADLAADFIHPVLGFSVAQLLESVDRCGVTRFTD